MALANVGAVALLIAGTALAALEPLPATADTGITGVVEHVGDGDGLVIDGHRIRLWGIDAVEQGQTCTDGAALPYPCGLRAAALGKTVRCRVVDEDRRYGRLVALCATDNGADLGAAMVAAGWARDYPRFSGGRYAEIEATARRQGAGIWAGRFDAPSDYRRTHAKNERR